ncbi:hypothetical protein A0H81_00612 [Grifola frondosa]|uniref:Uncharacterized protein n=1 Tax=Grifola frondosa TaxID=5627 RepID=A0A1C7MRR2_GRIFR|nr:hypothetical protein A0H81_00612 [Grifola frondosa]
MPLALSPIPEIAISLASPEEPTPEPFSPFSKCSFVQDDDDGFRPALLSPPPSAMIRRQLSPLRPASSPLTGKGLDRERFEALLQATRDRHAAVGGRKSTDLRKEIALKVHKNKQAERRALFLSKVQAPPSPTATCTPRLLQSPPPSFITPYPPRGSCEPWVEQVDFRLPEEKLPEAPLRSSPLPNMRKSMPSLDQITARLSSHGYVAAPIHETAAQQTRSSARLPSFLRSATRSPPQDAIPQIVVTGPAEKPGTKSRPTLPGGVGRLKFPWRQRPEQPLLEIAQPFPCFPPVSPKSPFATRLEITTTVVPRTASSSPVDLTESNLLALAANSREQMARDMLTRLRRRTCLSTIDVGPPNAFDLEDEQERKLRRHSAPPELPKRERSGFSHPVLELPGAF